MKRTLDRCTVVEDPSCVVNQTFQRRVWLFRSRDIVVESRRKTSPNSTLSFLSFVLSLLQVFCERAKVGVMFGD